ncbi:MAG TPA: hypothetical protein VKB35_19880 [Ktedonobacteraceae bacterium]|nr:hypothetical protein [Ktedonobacteraceae bacterium]
MLDGWLFYWLVVLAVIGLLCLSGGFFVTGLLIYCALRQNREIKAARDAEYEGMKQSLLNYRFDEPA